MATGLDGGAQLAALEQSAQPSTPSAGESTERSRLSMSAIFQSSPSDMTRKVSMGSSMSGVTTSSSTRVRKRDRLMRRLTRIANKLVERGRSDRVDTDVPVIDESGMGVTIDDDELTRPQAQDEAATCADPDLVGAPSPMQQAANTSSFAVGADSEFSSLETMRGALEEEASPKTKSNQEEVALAEAAAQQAAAELAAVQAMEAEGAKDSGSEAASETTMAETSPAAEVAADGAVAAKDRTPAANLAETATEHATATEATAATSHVPASAIEAMPTGATAAYSAASEVAAMQPSAAEAEAAEVQAADATAAKDSAEAAQPASGMPVTDEAATTEDAAEALAAKECAVEYSTAADVAAASERKAMASDTNEPQSMASDISQPRAEEQAVEAVATEGATTQVVTARSAAEDAATAEAAAPREEASVPILVRGVAKVACDASSSTEGPSHAGCAVGLGAAIAVGLATVWLLRAGLARRAAPV
eukprot:CAMPEP_0176054732 /NCGR_PEP_ID=MMETSP0120_2-20121206/27236_1 /TAXON_ID=160619 /ORGANISM="Kryptoperidinium foliaceum, Strain CCMP 1326" /LENGTH=478 /DNA_ID=CAMNT_0017388205 /DNA_START=15 /DNA_END=1451 /DNA_ORIENTATION=+